MTKSKQPQYRFDGFEGEWEEKKIRQYLKESRIPGTNGKIASKLTVKLWRKGVVKKSELYSGSESTKYFKRKSGQFMYGKLDFLNQAFGIIPIDLNGYESTLDSPAFDISKKIDPTFLLEYVSLEKFYRYQGNIANGSRKAKRIHVDTFLDMPITLPYLPEQEAIGELFQTVDQLIQLQDQKLATLKEQKQTFLRKMFPAQGQKVPEIRLQGFDGEWEEKKLGEISRMFSGGTPNVGIPEYYNGNIPFIRSAEINSDQTELSITDKGLSNSSAKLVEKNTLLYALYGATSGEVGLSRISGAINQAILAIIPEKKYSSLFIKNWLYKQKSSIIKKYLQGGQGNLSGSIVKELTIHFPSLSEQEAIGDFFQTLDQQMSQTEDKLTELKALKQTLLNRLFV
ncbi:restriction endonuclease subunit S [Streptococcus pyogenes]|uniref:restriction endonuclease subunit S n=1 Tax=Streptococcus pyogenes TaxID=1314 RepID=UPI0010A18BA9|nr:restriction endonuclease subunit S [Streptococcus pyogenes]VGQ77840.1 type I restriction modification DNA specificity domain protein [Streptococcus pyogenes]VHC01674.1 type I restriction modification DNA specificity domain protein [Streptococcus pyogenes]VHC37808.1 type I restriction modification DNA specificity domain protein [Streptococcus pyogenes]